MYAHILSEGGTGENRSDVTPLNFWVVLRFFAKICVFKKNLLSTYSPKKISFRPHCIYFIEKGVLGMSAGI